MMELACQVDPRFVAVPPGSRQGKELFHRHHRASTAAGEEPYFIIGADAFAEITTWHRWQDLVRLTEFIVVTRPGHNYYGAPGRARPPAGYGGPAGVFV